MSNTVRRLFTGFQPTNYQLSLTPDRETKQLHGTVTITGRKTGRPSQRLAFHQAGLKITSAQIVRHDKKGDQAFAVARINHHKTFEEVRLHTDTLLYAGQYTVTMTFAGRTQDSMHGIYLCNFEADGKKQQLVATQFESTHAREVFPCIDEPEAKATFDLTLVSPAGEAVIGNTPVKTQTEADGRLTTTFETSPRMSTYLVAFAYGNMHCKEAKTKGGVTVRAWASAAQSPAALDFPLDVGVRSVEFFNEYYGVDYPLAKCDLLALPDFSSGAMENWGLLTFRETAMLADPATTSQSAREYIAMVICHEVSHQWFGNLVTMQWWDDLWLNESFASVMEYVAVDALFPDWHIWNRFMTDDGLSAIRRDCIAGVQPIKVTVHHPDEIDSIFDPSIVYAKGARVLNMLRLYIGDDAFRAGLTAYFAKHAYHNTTGTDLWAAWSAASKQDIAAFMEPWLTQPGFPVITATQNDTQLTVAQQHFLLDPAKVDATRVWPVPLLCKELDLPLLATPQQTVALAQPQFVLLDQGAAGHYVTYYARTEHMQALAESVANKTFNITERLMLLSDSSMLARGGRQSFSASLELLKHYEHEDQESVWDIMALILGDGRRFVDLDPTLDQPMKAFAAKLIQEQYDRLGWDEQPNEDVHDTKLRATILGLGTYARHSAITERALQLFELYKKDAAAVPSELRGIVFAAAIRAQAPGAFDYLLNLYDTTQNADLKPEAKGALALTEDSAHIDQLLRRLTDTHKTRLQDVIGWAGALLRSRHSRPQAWQWLRDNWSWIEQGFSADKSYDYFPRITASAFNTQTLLNEYKAFFEPLQQQVALTRNITIGIEEMENRVAWLERDLAGVQAFFKAV